MEYFAISGGMAPRCTKRRKTKTSILLVMRKSEWYSVLRVLHNYTILGEFNQTEDKFKTAEPEFKAAEYRI